MTLPVTSESVDHAAIASLRQLLGARLSSAAPVREQHGKDASYHPYAAPDAVAFAQSTEEVREIVMHFLQLVEADPTKPAIGETKIQLLRREEQPTKEPQESPIMLPSQSRAVFISYAHADNESANRKQRWLDRFIEFLQPSVSQDDFTLCSDQDIKIGQNWHEHIRAHLDGAKAEVLQLCSHSVIGWPDAHPGPFGLRSIQMAAI